MQDEQHPLIEQVSFVFRKNRFLNLIYISIEPTSSNDDEDDDESETETHLIPREVLMVNLNFLC